MKEIVIAGAVRTPIGTFMGALSGVPAVDLGALAIQAVLERTGIGAEHVDEVVMGNVLQAGLGQGPARQAMIKAGLPHEIPATTINKICGSGLKAILMGVQAIAAGDAELIVAGGMENMSQAPYVLPGARAGYRLGDAQVVDTMMKDGLSCAVCDVPMGITAENIAERYGISREEQDAFALQSQHKAEQAMLSGRFAEEIVPVTVKGRKGEAISIDKDEHPRSGLTSEQLAKLKPAFKKDGTVTPGNASGINDGAAAVIVCTREKADALGLKPLARIRSYGYAGVDPAFMGLGPVPAVRKALAKADLTIQDIGLAEINEAFAVQSLAVLKDLELNPDIVNVNGGAIALGHPIGASGARVVVTLLHEMKRRAVNLGLASLCVGGGHGVAVIVERIE